MGIVHCNFQTIFKLFDREKNLIIQKSVPILKIQYFLFTYRFPDSLPKKIMKVQKKSSNFFFILFIHAVLAWQFFCITVSVDGYYFLCVETILGAACSYHFARSIEDPSDKNFSVSTLTHLYMHVDCI